MVKILPYFLIISIILFVLFPRINNSLNQYVLGHTEAHKTLYLSENFDEYEYNIICQAALEWQVATHNLVQFNIQYGYDQNILNKIANTPDSMIVVKAASREALVKSLDESTEKNVLGYFSNETSVQKVILVVDRMIDATYFKAVVLHELGHSLGLPHIEKKNTIMYQYMENTYSLTKSDIRLFCQAYYCDPDSL